MLELCAARPSNRQRNNTEGLGVDDSLTSPESRTQDAGETSTSIPRGNRERTGCRRNAAANRRGPRLPFTPGHLRSGTTCQLVTLLLLPE